MTTSRARTPEIFLFWLCCAATLCISLESRWLESAWLLAAFAVCSMRLMRFGAPPWELLPIGAMIAAGALQIASGRTQSLVDTRFAIAGWLGAACLFWAIFALSAEVSARERLVSWFEMFGVLVCAWCVLQPLLPDRFPDGLGPFQSRNNFAAFAELLVPVLFYRAAIEKRFVLCRCLAASILLMAVAATGARAGSVLIALELMVFAGLVIWKRGIEIPRPAAAVVACVLVLAGVFITWGTGGGLARFHETNPLLYRIEIAQSAIAMVKERPLVGFGLGTFAAVYPAYASIDPGAVVTHAHNDWLEWTAEGGILAGTALVLGAVAAARAAFQATWGIGVIAVFLHSLVDFHLQRWGIAAWVIALAAMAAAQRVSGSRPAIRDFPIATALARADESNRLVC